MQLARYIPTESPHQYRDVVPPRAAYSHSASLGSLYGCPATLDSQAMYWPISSQLTLWIGVRSSATRMRGRKLHRLAAMHAFHSATVTGVWPMANARTSTRCAGSDSCSREPCPIMKLPLGMRTIRGQVGQSWNRFASPPRGWVDGMPTGGMLAAVIIGADPAGRSFAGAGCGCAAGAIAGLSGVLAGVGAGVGAGIGACDTG